jgi:phosphoribosylformylglycinamidine synthase
VKWRAEIRVWLKEGVFDPQGQAIQQALSRLGLGRIGEVRAGKAFLLQVEAPEREEARRLAEEAAGKLLANPVLESFSLEVEPSPESGSGGEAG